jgi:hypothetical protein
MHGTQFARLAVTALVFVSLAASGAPRAEAAGAEIVRFRLSKWKAAHIDDSESAKSLAATLKEIGCEVQQHAHDGHFDVRYRCVEWRSISLQSHDEAHKWERWLKAKGFQTQHTH